MTAKSWKFHATLWAVFHLVSITIDYCMGRGSRSWGWDWFYSLCGLNDIVFLLQAMVICYFIIWLSRKILPQKPVLFFVIMALPLLFLAVGIDYLTSIFFEEHFNKSFKQFYGERAVVGGVLVPALVAFLG